MFTSLLISPHSRCYILKSDQVVAVTESVVLLTYLLDHIGDNNRSYNRRILRQSSALGSLHQHVITEDRTEHIARKFFILIILAVISIHSKPIRIRICDKNQLSADLLRQLKTQGIRLCALRIWGLYSWEITILNSLFLNDMYILETKFAENSCNRLKACSVKRRIYDLQISRLLNLLRIHDKLVKLSYICVIDLLTDHIQQSCIYCSVLVHSLNHGEIFYIVDLCNDLLILRRYDLGSIIPVNLISVVFLWIVACRYIHADIAVQMSHCK